MYHMKLKPYNGFSHNTIAFEMLDNKFLINRYTKP